jgi:hypothetical protein
MILLSGLVTVIKTTSRTETQAFISYLRYINQAGVLSQHRITDWRNYETFAEFADDFFAMAAYPSAQISKMETYSFVPTLFDESYWTPKSQPNAAPIYGHWRTGEHAADDISLMYLDCDNSRDDCDHVTTNKIEAVLKDLDLSHVLYTSFSHTVEKHKVRVLLPISRPVTYEEASRLFIAFNWMFGYQLDASIYDRGDHLYGPPCGGERRIWTLGCALDVDTLMEVVDDLPEEAKEMAKTTRKEPSRKLTPVEREHTAMLMQNTTVRDDVSIRNAEVFNPAWMADLVNLSNGGSHRMTLLSVLTKVFVKSGHTLNFGELRAIQTQLDWEAWSGYCITNYPASELDRDVRSVLNFRATETSTPTTEREQREFALRREMERWAKRTKATVQN